MPLDGDLESAMGGRVPSQWSQRLDADRTQTCPVADPALPVTSVVPRVPQSRGGAHATLETMQAKLRRICKSPNQIYSELLDQPIDSVGDETDSDDGDNGDFVEVEPYQHVVGGRTTNSSR